MSTSKPQLFIHMQWWSILRMHRWQVLQWCALGGFANCSIPNHKISGGRSEKNRKSRKRIHSEIQKKDPLWSTHTDKLPGSACTSGRLKSSHPASFKLASDQITWRMTYMMNPSQMLRIIVSLQWLCQLRTFTPLQIQEHFGFHCYYGKLLSYYSLQSNNHWGFCRNWGFLFSEFGSELGLWLCRQDLRSATRHRARVRERAGEVRPSCQEVAGLETKTCSFSSLFISFLTFKTVIQKPRLTFS